MLAYDIRHDLMSERFRFFELHEQRHQTRPAAAQGLLILSDGAKFITKGIKLAGVNVAASVTWPAAAVT